MKYIDTHAHLSDSAFEQDRQTLIENIFSKGISNIFEILCSAKDWDKTNLFEKYKEKFYFAFGIHPEYIEQNEDKNFLLLKEKLRNEKAIFIGEIGLDYWWDNSHKEEQKELLKKQLEISNEISKPVVFHCRNGKTPQDNAYTDLFDEIYKYWDYKGKNNKRGILHSFSGDFKDAQKAIELGIYLGINGTFTYPKNGKLREIVKKFGIENIVLETDCPYLPPQSIRGQRNTPLSIIEICQSISNYLEKGFGIVRERVYLNSISFIQ